MLEVGLSNDHHNMDDDDDDDDDITPLKYAIQHSSKPVSRQDKRETSVKKCDRNLMPKNLSRNASLTRMSPRKKQGARRLLSDQDLMG